MSDTILNIGQMAYLVSIHALRGWIMTVLASINQLREASERTQQAEDAKERAMLQARLIAAQERIQRLEAALQRYQQLNVEEL
ncbi:MAG: hypothetical protein GY753_09730 [Gammaproteobacteria bacterium]|nr:hypothetical protein [Gammaproteobacteria bacterium]